MKIMDTICLTIGRVVVFGTAIIAVSVFALIGAIEFDHWKKYRY